ncbi:hypothetical protein HV337_08925 [Citrobacter freundii]|uniref:hypothetical protein n=1 Tax=Citrobacter freundii TaxID=546 RepID=UPI0015E8FB42|nr:hypothetical protein [Citrobacter freundii]QLR72659.1 hypothetical protein HV337_08925 [Citrobacter freundii]QLY51881.1 hypothetical protein HV186_09025 [Citrobacter freundii]
MTLTALASSTPPKLRSLFNIQQSYCAIKTNGVTGYDNRDSAWRGRGGGISSTNALMLMENGENEISLEIGALSWFSDKSLSPKERGHFDPQSACSLELVRFNGQEKQTLSSIKVTINPQGLPEALPDETHPINRTKILAEQVIPGHIDPDYFDSTYFPQGMVLYRFTQKVTVSGIPEWAWVKAEPFTGSSEQLQKLRAAYSKMAEIINKRDRSHLKKLYKTALEGWSTSTGDSEDEILLSRFTKDKLEGGKAKIIPIEWGNYNARVMNNGRMVQLYNKSDQTYSPLTYKYTDEDGEEIIGCYAPVFSLINGEFVPVT